MYEIETLKSKKLPELQEMAKAQGVKRITGLKKMELIYQIIDTVAAAPGDENVANPPKKEKFQPRAKGQGQVNTEKKTNDNPESDNPKGKEEVTVSREAFKDTEREVVATSETIQPVPEQPVQAQNRFFRTAIWAAAAVVLAISIVEFGGFSISSVVRDLLASR